MPKTDTLQRIFGIPSWTLWVTTDLTFSPLLAFVCLSMYICMYLSIYKSWSEKGNKGGSETASLLPEGAFRTENKGH